METWAANAQDGRREMMFWCSGSGVTFDYPLKLIPWYERPRGGASLWMVDSGVKADPPTVEELLRSQEAFADVAVCPDILGNASATIERTKMWMPEITRLCPEVTRVVCTQGTDDERRRIMDEFPGAHYYGAGLNDIAPGVRCTPEERERILRWFVPEVHARGKKVHIFGIGTSDPYLNLFYEIGVDSFDTSTVVRAAAHGQFLNHDLIKIKATQSRLADDKRHLIALSIRNIEDRMAYYQEREAWLT